MKRRILSLFLAVVMIVLAIPAVILPTLGATVDASYKSSFSDADIVAEYANKANYPTGTEFEFPAGWEVAVMSPTTWNTSYYEAKYSFNNGEAFKGGSGTGSWMSDATGGGFYFRTGQLVAPISYTNEASDLNGDGETNKNDRTFSKLDANVLVRYTAEHTGTVSIDVSKLVFTVDWNALFCILVNGRPTAQFAEDFDYATGAGWFDPSAVDATSAINTVANVTVEKGDVIDFVFRGNGCDGNTLGFNYDDCKRFATDWTFDVTYSKMELTSAAGVSTSFNILNNFPVADYKNAYNDGWSAFVEPSKDLKFSYDDKAWQLGSLDVDYNESKVTSTAKLEDYLSVGTSFQPYTFVASSSNSEFFLVNDNYGMNGATTAGKSGSVYVRRIGSDAAPQYIVAMASGIQLANLQGDAADVNGDGTVDSKDRVCTAYVGTATIRYVAQFSGKASVALDAAWMKSVNKGYCQLWILRNGTPVAKIMHEDKAIKETLNVTLTAGDTLDFVCVADPVYSALALDETNENFYRSDITSFDPDANRRNVQINNIEVTYEDGAIGAGSSVWNANSVTNGFNSSNQFPFFTWYDATGKELSHGTALNSTCTAKISDTIKTWAGITDGMTLREAYDAYWQKYMQVNKLTYTSDRWQMVAMDASGNAQTIAYTYGWHNIPFASLDRTSGTKAHYNNDGQYIASAEAMTSLQADLWNKLISKSGLSSDTKVANVEMAYDIALWDTYNTAGGSNSNSFANSIYYIRPSNKGSTNTYGGYEYTVQNTGVVSIALTDIAYKDAATFTWNVAHNGKYVFATAQDADISTANGIQALKDAIGAVSVYAQAGDTVTVCFARNAGGNATFLAPSFKVTETYAPTVKATPTVNLAIKESFAVKLSVAPGVANGAVDVIVDGNVLATLDAENGYTCTLKDDIKVNELTCTSSTTAGWVQEGDIDGVTISYKLREAVGDHVITSDVYTTTTNEMLSYYENCEDAKAAALATEIRHLAVAVDASLRHTGHQGDMTEAEKYHMRGRVDGVNLTDNAIVALQANKPAYGYVDDKTAFDYVIAAANVNMGNKISLVFLVQANGAADLNALREGFALRAYEGEVLAAEATEFKSVILGDTEYLGVIVDVPVAKYNSTDLTFAVETADGTAVSAALQYSVNAWIANRFTNTDGWNDYVIRAVYNLGVAAAAYAAN